MDSNLKNVTLVIGCGYLGLPLAMRLKSSPGAGSSVIGWVGSEPGAQEAKAAGLDNLVIGDVADPAVWQDQLGDRASEITHVFHCASSNRGGAEAYRQVFLHGSEQVLLHCPNARFVLVSSTSVYGQTGGEIVNEDSPAEPGVETGRILREAEGRVLASGGIVARSAAIYGPGRAVSWEKFQSGRAVIEADGGRWMNQIHRDDLINALCLISERGSISSIYNVCDNSPVTQADFYTWCAEFTGKPLPPHGPLKTNRKRGLTNKRVSNAKLKSLGWQPQFPSFREGIASLSSLPD